MCEPCRPQRGRDGFAGDSRRRRAGREAETDAAATPVHGEATWEREGGRRRLIPRGAGGSKTQRQHREESTYLGSHGGESVTDEGMRDRLGGSRWLVRRMMLAKKDAGERSLGIGGFFGVRPLGWAGAEPAASGQRQDLAGEAGLCWAGSWRHDSSPGQLSRTPQRGPDDSSSAAAGTGAGGLGPPPPPPPRTTSPHLGCPGGRAVWGAHASGIQGTPAQAATARKRNAHGSLSHDSTGGCSGARARGRGRGAPPMKGHHVENLADQQATLMMHRTLRSSNSLRVVVPMVPGATAFWRTCCRYSTSGAYHSGSCPIGRLGLGCRGESLAAGGRPGGGREMGAGQPKAAVPQAARACIPQRSKVGLPEVCGLMRLPLVAPGPPYLIITTDDRPGRLTNPTVRRLSRPCPLPPGLWRGSRPEVVRVGQYEYSTSTTAHQQAAVTKLLSLALGGHHHTLTAAHGASMPQPQPLLLLSATAHHQFRFVMRAGSRGPDRKSPWRDAKQHRRQSLPSSSCALKRASGIGVDTGIITGGLCSIYFLPDIALTGLTLPTKVHDRGPALIPPSPLDRDRQTTRASRGELDNILERSSSLARASRHQKLRPPSSNLRTDERGRTAPEAPEAASDPVSSPAQPSPAQPSPAQSSPARLCPAHARSLSLRHGSHPIPSSHMTMTTTKPPPLLYETTHQPRPGVTSTSASSQIAPPRTTTHSSSRPLPLSGSAPRVIRASPSSRSRASVAQGGNKHTSSSGPEQDSWAPLLSLSLSLQRADLLASQGSQWPPSVPYLVLHWVRVPSSKPPSVLPPVASFRLPPRPTWAFLARRPRLADLTLPTRAMRQRVNFLLSTTETASGDETSTTQHHASIDPVVIIAQSQEVPIASTSGMKSFNFIIKA
ncbi:hypothetical protein PCL_02843 [Purpureocillium lilacinum]|uniref:Uncharacterized protein n=1 Tax=Purpureocillium lilacinum TaxID=33203 RepID=A0A2U3DZ03_PURLI|nr:hypothetical protein PCL_02843 [Purpureocillium lilacinum]